jgi:photosystem II stability/assembly factor-like uncharacterized protein
MKQTLVIILVFVVIVVIVAVVPLALRGDRDGSYGSQGPAGIFKSFDEGQNWFLRENINGQEVKLSGFSVESLVVGVGNPQIMYLGTEGKGLYKSFDAGETWRPVFDELGNLSSKATVFDIALNDSNEDELYLSVFQGNFGYVFKSQDGGRSFERVYITPSRGIAVGAITVDKSDFKHILIGTTQGGVLESGNSGQEWTLIRWFPGAVKGIVLNPVNANEIYLFTAASKLFKSVNGGSDWLDLSRLLGKISSSALKIEKIVFDPINHNTIYLATGYGILTSSNGGTDFSTLPLIVPPELLPIYDIAVVPQSPRVIYTAAGSQLFKSDDGGLSWSVQPLSTQKVIKLITFNPKDFRFIYLGFEF